MKKTYLYSALFACLALSLVFYNNRFNNVPPEGTGNNSSPNASTVSVRQHSGIEKKSPPNNSAKKTTHHRKQREPLPSTLSALAAEDKVRQAQLRKEIIRKYKKTRNLYLADTTMSTADKQKLIAQLDTSIFGGKQQNREPSDEDLYEQARYREIMSNLQHDAQALKLDASLSRQQKEDEIRQLLSDFMADIDS